MRSIDDLDVIAPGAFVSAAAPLFEGARGFLGRLAVARPFGSSATMFETARRIAHAMPVDEQIELIDAHPRLGAAPASVSALSFAEQGYGAPEARLADPAERARAEVDPAEVDPADVATRLARQNAAYETKFGFRYCVFVAGRSRSELLPDMEVALGADRDVELHRALDAVIDIARDRWATLAQAGR
jgi:2-oxo-4-hydroxy-4-carboxy-5-ureidoimidazoline decarboxylase